jgi:hypothetical protein
MPRDETIAIFGATGTAGYGVLKAAMNDPVVKKIHVITRRTSLFDLAEGTKMKVVSYRPAYIVPTEDQASFSNDYRQRLNPVPK